MEHPMRHSILAALAGLTMMTATPAFAETPRAAIRFGDLNLNNRAGAEVFLNRAERAAYRTCGDRLGRMPVHERMLIRECERDFLQRAVVRLDNANVSTLYRNRGGRSPDIIIASR
jgi:UrcA family protein